MKQEVSLGHVTVEHNGLECRVQRRIEKPAVTLKIGSDTYTGVKKVQEAMETVLGIDRDVLKQSVFVRQTEIESVLFTDPRERELAFQKLIGLGDAAKHQKFLTDFLSAAGDPQDMGDEIARQESLVAAQTDELQRLRAESAKQAKALAEVGDEDRIEAMRQSLQQQLAAVDAAIAAMEELDGARRRLSECKEPGPQQDTAPAQKQLDELNKAVFENKMVKARNEDRRRTKCYLDSARNDLAKIPADLDSRIEDFEGRQALLAAAKAETQRLGKLLANAPDGNVCPLCGSTTDHNIQAELQAERDASARRESELSAWLANHSGLLASRDKRSRLEAEVATRQKEYDRLGPEEPEKDADSLASALADVSGALGRMTEENKSNAYLSARREACLKSVSECEARLEKVLSPFARREGGYTAEYLQQAKQGISFRMEELRKSLAAISELKVARAQFEGGIAQIERSLDSAKASIVELHRIDAQNKAKAKKLQVVREVKDWFGYRNGPRVMTQAVMSLLVDETNRFLGLFGSEFSVVPLEEGMGFRYRYNDGRPVSSPLPEATMLSGGQKIALAVAFRFAVYTMFAAKLGFLSLDEPTAYLDDATIARFGDMLGKIREIAANMNVQVLLSTHEKSLESAMDQTILL